MFQDEARFGRMNDPMACWAPLPVRPLVGAQLVREFVYVYGAVSPLDGCHDSLILPDANTESMVYFIGELVRRHPDEYLLLFMDQAGWHKSTAKQLPEHVEIAFLPPYCPDCNPQEQVWDEVREKAFGNRVFDSLDAVMDQAEVGLNELEATPRRLQSLAGYPWILEAI